MLGANLNYGDRVLGKNMGTVFSENLEAIHTKDSFALERGSSLLGATGAQQKGTVGDCPIARKIEFLIGGITWKDNSDAINEIVSRQLTSLETVVRLFVKDREESDGMIVTEIERAFVHLWKHVLDNKHILLSIENKQVGKSFFFMLLSPPLTEQSRSEFLNALRGLLSVNFSRGGLSLQEGDNGRSCVQVEYKISGLFDEPFYVSGIPIYSLENFRFIPISGGYIAKSIVLRFTIQKLGTVRRLYLMTLFPAEKDTHLFISDDKLRALSILNGVNPMNLFKPQSLPLRHSECIPIIDIHSAPVILQRSQIDHFYVDTPAPRNLATTDSTVIFEKSGENSWGCLLL